MPYKREKDGRLDRKIQKHTDKDKTKDETVCFKLVSLRPGWDRISNVANTRMVACLRILRY